MCNGGLSVVLWYQLLSSPLRVRKLKFKAVGISVSDVRNWPHEPLPDQNVVQKICQCVRCRRPFICQISGRI